MGFIVVTLNSSKGEESISSQPQIVATITEFAQPTISALHYNAVYTYSIIGAIMWKKWCNKVRRVRLSQPVAECKKMQVLTWVLYGM